MADKDFIDTPETFKDFFDHAHDLMHIVQPNGQIVYVNQAWKDHLHFSQEEVKGRLIYDFIAEEDRARFAQYREATIDERSVAEQIEVSLLTKTGARVPVEGFITVRRIDGSVRYSRGIFRDVSMRKQNEAELLRINAELKERETNLQQLLQHAPDSVIVIDDQGLITYWNPKSEKIFGWTSDEVVGRALSETIVPPQYRSAHEQGMKRFLSTGVAHVLNQTIEIHALHKNGREFYISLTISAARQEGRTVFISFIRDIDKEKQNELELERKRLELEQSNEELEQFAHVASHDMKEPVRKIQLFSNRLREEEAGLSPRGKSYLLRVENSARRLSEMIDGILAYSSINTEKPDFEQVDLNEILETVLSELELVIEEKQATIEKSLLPVVPGSPFLLFQLFYNLITNALKFSKPDSRPEIQISVSYKEADSDSSKDQSDHWVGIRIRDNGIGFRADKSDLIFEKFSRLHSKDRYEGTGLGLALCKNIVKKHGGLISANSEEGKWSDFIIELPASPKY